MVKEILTESIWELLKTIPDPEIPAVSIVDLGIVRNVEFDDDQFNITITPTSVSYTHLTLPTILLV